MRKLLAKIGHLKRTVKKGKLSETDLEEAYYKVSRIIDFVKYRTGEYVEVPNDG